MPLVSASLPPPSPVPFSITSIVGSPLMFSSIAWTSSAAPLCGKQSANWPNTRCSRDLTAVRVPLRAPWQLGSTGTLPPAFFTFPLKICAIRSTQWRRKATCGGGHRNFRCRVRPSTTLERASFPCWHPTQQVNSPTYCWRDAPGGSSLKSRSSFVP